MLADWITYTKKKEDKFKFPAKTVFAIFGKKNINSFDHSFNFVRNIFCGTELAQVLDLFAVSQLEYQLSHKS